MRGRDELDDRETEPRPTAAARLVGAAETVERPRAEFLWKPVALVRDVELDGISPIVTTFVTAFVRRAIAEQLNPFEVLPVSQLSLSLPVQVSGGVVKAIVKDVRSEVQEGTLKLYLTYDFSAEKKSG